MGELFPVTSNFSWLEIYLIAGVLVYQLLTYMEARSPDFETVPRFLVFVAGYIATILFWPLALAVVIYQDYFRERSKKNAS